MSRSLRRAACVGWLAAAVMFALASSASAASLPFNNWVVSGHLTLAKLNQNVNLPAGSTFNGSVDLGTGALTGNVSIPQFTAHLTVLGLVPVDATLRFVPTSPVSGHVTVGSPTTITATSAAIIQITRLSSPLLPLNLVGNSCQTSAPVVLPLNYTGPLTLSTGFTFNGSTTIPPLQNCGLATPLLSLLMSGPNNPFSVTLAP